MRLLIIQMQGTAHAGACCFTTIYPYNVSNVMTITAYLYVMPLPSPSPLIPFTYIWPVCARRSTGLRSRGRIGIDAALTAHAIEEPWLRDSNDKSVLMQGVRDIVSNINTIPNLVMISPDNTTTITDFVNNYATVRFSSLHLL